MIDYVKTCKFRWLRSEYFSGELKMIYLFLEAHKTMKLVSREALRYVGGLRAKRFCISYFYIAGNGTQDTSQSL